MIKLSLNLQRWNIIKYFILFLLFNHLYKVKAENQCSSNLDCVKYNTEVDHHVCIRWDGQKDYVCYLESEAYCKSDDVCKSYDESLKYCYVPPWISNKNSQKQCFTVHKENGVCVEDFHCAEGLVCIDNVCIVGTSQAPNKNNGSNNSTLPSKGNSGSSNSTMYLEFEEDKKDKPIEIIGLPLWAFITIVAVPIVIIIAILWGLSIGRKSYRDEEEKKKNRMALKNSKKDLESNQRVNISTDKLSSQATPTMKEDLVKNYLNNNATNSSSSNSTVTNNHLTVPSSETKLNNKNSQMTMESQLRKKSNTNLSTSGVSTKPKKPKSKAASEYSDSNSHKGLLNAGMSAADSGVYSSYFGAGGSAISQSYFSQPMTTNNDMNNYYYQQMIAAQQMQAQQMQAQQMQAQQMYYQMDGANMPTIEMMQYQQLYGNMMNGGMSAMSSMSSLNSMSNSNSYQNLYAMGSENNVSSGGHKHKGGKSKHNNQ